MWLVMKMIQLVCATVCVYFFFFFAYTPACQSSRWLLLEHINITRAHFQVYLLPIIEGKWLKAEGLLRVVAERRKTNHLFRHMDGQTDRRTATDGGRWTKSCQIPSLPYRFIHRIVCRLAEGGGGGGS